MLHWDVDPEITIASPFPRSMPDRRAPTHTSDTPGIQQSAVERVLKRVLAVTIVIALAFYFGVAAIAVLLRYVIVPHIDTFRPRIEAVATKALGTPVHIDRLSARWQSLAPEFTIDGLRIQGPDGNAALRVDHAFGVVAWRSLLRLKPIFTNVEIDGADLVASRGNDGKVNIAGITLGQRHGNPYGLTNWLLAQRAIIVRRTTVHWRDAYHGDPELTLQNVQLALLNVGAAHRFGLQAGFADPTLGKLDIRANFTHRRLAALLAGKPLAHVSDIGDFHTWQGDVYLSTGTVNLASIGRYINLPIAATGGDMQAHAWAHFANGKVNSIDGNLSGTGLALQVRPGLPALSMPRVTLDFSASQNKGDYHAAIRHLSLELANQTPLADGTAVNRTLDVARFDAEYRVPKVGVGERILLSGDVADIGLLADFSRALPLPLRLKRNLERYDPKGVLTDYALQWERDAPESERSAQEARVEGNVPLSHYQLHAKLDGVSVAAQEPAPGLNAAGHPHIGQPGFQNINGTVDATEMGGTLRLDSHDASVTIRGMFDEPTIPFDTLTGDATWSISGEGKDRHVDAQAPNLVFANPQAAGHLQVRFQSALNAAQFGQLTLHGTLTRAQLVAIPRYLPTSIGPKLRQYLGHAFLAGNSENVTIEASGHLQDLPYPHGTMPAGQAHLPSTFIISAPFTGGAIDLSPYPAVFLPNGDAEKWPSFSGATGRFFVNGTALGFDVSTAHYRSVQLHQLTGRIANLADMSAPLIVQGSTSGPLADMVHFVNNSPLGYWSAHATAALETTGNARLNLRLEVPRHKEGAPASASTSALASTSADSNTPAARTNASTNASATATTAVTSASTSAPHAKIPVTGSIDFDHNRVALGKTPPIENLTGHVNFTEHTATFTGLRGTLLGGDLLANGNVSADGTTDIRVTGALAPRNALAGDVPLSKPLAAVLQRMSGSTNYVVSVHRNGHTAPEFTLTSSLRGLGVDLPAPLGKAADAALPVSLRWRTIVDTAMEAANLPKPVAEHRPTWRNGAGTLVGTLPRAPGTPPPPQEPVPAPLQQVDLMAGPVRATYLRRGGSQPEVIAGTIGINRLAPVPKHGVTASVALDKLDVDAWRSVLAEMNTRETGASAASPAVAGAVAPIAASASTPTGTPTVTPSVTSTIAPAATRALADNAAATSADVPETTDTAAASTSKSSAAAWLPSRFDIDIDDVLLLGRHWHDLVLTGNRSATYGWESQVNSREVAGAVEWQPEAGSAIHARFTKVNVPIADSALAQQAAEKMEPVAGRVATRAVSHYPAVDLIADNVSIGARHIGRVELLAHNVDAPNAPIWRIDRFGISNADATLSALGDWASVPPSTSADGTAPTSETALRFQLALRNTGALFDQLGLPKTLAGGHGQIDGAIRWQGSPGSIDTKTLNGALRMHLEKGQLLKVNPGAARLLGVLSLQGLARYLQLDFKGLFGKGLAFDRISGTAQIVDGVATTQDAELLTAPARVTMVGSTDIPLEQQHLFVTVIPHLNAGSVSIAAAVVNPLLGLGSLVAQLALAEPISRSLTRYYEVNGAWAKPHVERVKSNRGNMPTSTEGKSQ